MSISILRLIPQIATMINKNKLQFTKRHGTYLSRDALAIGRWLSTRPRIQIQILPRPSRWRLSCFLSCGWRSSWRWRSLAWWWPWGSLWRWYCPKSFFAKCRETVSWRKKCKKTKRKKRKKCKKKVNPNNSVNIEIKGGSGGGPKKNPVPPSPAASKKVPWIDE